MNLRQLPRAGVEAVSEPQKFFLEVPLNEVDSKVCDFRVELEPKGQAVGLPSGASIGVLLEHYWRRCEGVHFVVSPVDGGHEALCVIVVSSQAPTNLTALSLSRAARYAAFQGRSELLIIQY